jgi:hypothetical protein
MFSRGNYCENYHDVDKEDEARGFIRSGNAEVAIMESGERDSTKWVNFGNDNLTGYVEPDDVAKMIGIVSTSSSIEEITNRLVEIGLIKNRD